MVVGVRVQRLERPVRGGQALLAPADGGRHQVEHLDDGGAERGHRAHRTPSDVVRHAAALAVGDVGERDQRRLVGHGVGLLGGVADGVHVGMAGLVGVVDGDAAPRADGEAGHLGEAHVGPHADRTDHEVGGEHATVGQGDGVGFDRGHLDAGLDGDPVGHELVLDQDRQLGVERRHDLGRGLHDRDVEALVHEVLGHLEADEPGADHHGGLRRRVHVGGEAGGVLDGPQRADPVVPGDGRAHRRRTHREHELVVGHDALLPRVGGAHGDLVGLRVDGDHLGRHVDVEPEAVEQRLGGLEGEVLLLLDHAPDEVREAAVRERHVAGALEHGDRGAGVEAAQARGRRHAAGDAADDHDAQGIALGAAHDPLPRRPNQLRRGASPPWTLPPPVAAVSRHRHRWSLGTEPKTCSTWAPQPLHVGRPHRLHVTALHIPPRVYPRQPPTNPATRQRAAPASPAEPVPPPVRAWRSGDQMIR